MADMRCVHRGHRAGRAISDSTPWRKGTLRAGLPRGSGGGEAADALCLVALRCGKLTVVGEMQHQ